METGCEESQSLLHVCPQEPYTDRRNSVSEASLKYGKVYCYKDKMLINRMLPTAFLKYMCIFKSLSKHTEKFQRCVSGWWDFT